MDCEVANAVLSALQYTGLTHGAPFEDILDSDDAERFATALESAGYVIKRACVTADGRLPAAGAMRDWRTLREHDASDGHRVLGLLTDRDGGKRHMVIRNMGAGYWKGDDGMPMGAPAESWLVGWWELPGEEK